MATMNGSARPAPSVTGILDSVSDVIEGGRVAPHPNPEVVARAKRRRFTGEYKQKVLIQTDAAQGSGEIGTVLRRAGLYSSHLTKWRREREEGILDGLTPQKRGPKSKANPLAGENQKLRRDNERLADRLRKAEIVIDVQKSGHAAGPSISGDGGVVSAALGELTPIVGGKATCEALPVPRASFYRKRGSGDVFPAAAPVRFIPRALDTAEREAVLAGLPAERFQNCAPAAVYATLLDAGRYHCSIRTLCRILEGEGEARERRDHLARQRRSGSISHGKHQRIKLSKLCFLVSQRC
jgi:transposase-like protein